MNGQTLEASAEPGLSAGQSEFGVYEPVGGQFAQEASDRMSGQFDGMPVQPNGSHDQIHQDQPPIEAVASLVGGYQAKHAVESEEGSAHERHEAKVAYKGSKITIDLGNGILESQQVVGRSPNGGVIVLEERINTNSDPTRQVERSQHAELSTEDAMILLDQLQRAKGEQNPREIDATLSSKEYEELYGPLGMNTGEGFSVIYPDGSFFDVELDPLRHTDNTRRLLAPRTIKVTNYDSQGNVYKTQHRKVDWEIFKADHLKYAELNRDSLQYAIPYEQTVHGMRLKSQAAAR